jgi:hypothetical protein
LLIIKKILKKHIVIMNDIHRILIFLLLGGLLYALYTYQQKMLKNIEPPKPVIEKKHNKEKNNKENDVVTRERESKSKSESKSKEKDKSSKKSQRKKVSDDNESIDNVSVGNISQYSLGSLEDLKTEKSYKKGSNKKDPYKQDSALESVDNNVSLIDEDEDSFFFP